MVETCKKILYAQLNKLQKQYALFYVLFLLVKQKYCILFLRNNCIGLFIVNKRAGKISTLGGYRDRNAEKEDKKRGEVQEGKEQKNSSYLAEMLDQRQRRHPIPEIGRASCRERVSR